MRENEQRVRIHLNAPRDCLAVIAESYYPYWRAEVDGKPAEVLRVSCALMGVNLPAGTHESCCATNCRAVVPLRAW